MTSSEIFSKCLPKSLGMLFGTGGKPNLTWEDVQASLAGCEAKHYGFIRYVYQDDPKGHHDFFAGMMMEACSRPDIQRWAKTNPGKIEGLVLFAIREWKHSRAKYTDESRAYAYGVRVHVWRRRYKNTYQIIVGIPTYWEDEILQRVRKRLS